ncbi:MAG: CBS domain-containing protein [Sandaracinaceae bacterium]|nr:CBS domain-containing protein [Sandaracinaceae bacterium]
MGEQSVKETRSERESRAFMKALLADVHALEIMIERGMFDTGPRRIGAEQEMFLIDKDMMPAPVAVEVLDEIEDSRIVSELARFNLEANTEPRLLRGNALSSMEAELTALVTMADGYARRQKAQVLLTGILPTLRRPDLGLDNMTPSPRYRALNDTLLAMRGGDFQIAIKGTDELNVQHDNVMFEACNTSFQVHFQVAPPEFAKLYNVAQLVTGPVLAAAVNSPLLFGSRLWKETRVALFSSSIDDRSTKRQRSIRPRVTFGDGWVQESVLEIFREQIARFRVLLSTPDIEDPMEALERGEVPKLGALRLHNGTVYRWNRACYGETDGVAHLRIENRVLPAGPTIIDEVANAAFFFGLMSGVLEGLGNPRDRFDFDDAKANFFAAARQGLKAQFTWLGGEIVTAADLIRQRLLPLAREGLEHVKLDRDDIDRYLGVIEARVTSTRTGAQWMLDSHSALSKDMEASGDMVERRILGAMLEHQREGTPVHEWPICEHGTIRDREDEWRRGLQRVGQFMTTDLFTVRPTDLVDLAASVMDWEHVKHIPVEDDGGHLLGLVTHRSLLRLVARGKRGDDPVIVEDIMIRDPETISPDTSTLLAMEKMRENGYGCLPVVEAGKLVGVITQSDLIRVSSRLLEKFLKGEP